LSDKNAEISFSDKKIFGGYNNLFTEKKVVLDGENKFILAGYNYLVFENN
jgi:hypothetical protein